MTITDETAPEPGPGAGSAPIRARAAFRVAAWDRIRAALRPIPWWLLAVVAVGFVVAGQFAEDLADSAPLQMLPPVSSSRRWTLIAAVIYMLLISRVVDRTVQRSLPSLKRVLRIDAVAFRAYADRLRPPDVGVGVVILVASALIVTVLFVGLGSDLPITNDPITDQPLFLPDSLAASLLVLAGYTVVGWAGLSLVYLTIRLGRALGELCREPLEVDVFDTSNLLPFGNIALAGALAPAGIIVILLLGLGQPTGWLSWTVLLLAAVASVLALLLPLRGVHRQMAEAKDAVLGNLNARIRGVYEDVHQDAADFTAVPSLNERTNTLIPLRRTVHEMTTWPFADTVAFGRAVLIASAPLIYTVLSELIRVFWIVPLTP